MAWYCPECKTSLTGYTFDWNSWRSEVLNVQWRPSVYQWSLCRKQRRNQKPRRKQSKWRIENFLYAIDLTHQTCDLFCLVSVVFWVTWGQLRSLKPIRHPNVALLGLSTILYQKVKVPVLSRSLWRCSIWTIHPSPIFLLSTFGDPWKIARSQVRPIFSVA